MPIITITVSGPRHVGKSRLIAELREFVNQHWRIDLDLGAGSKPLLFEFVEKDTDLGYAWPLTAYEETPARLPEKQAKFAVGDQVLFMPRKYHSDHAEGVVRGYFGTGERRDLTFFQYKIRYGWRQRTIWVDEDDIKGKI